jgi:hypothetical protein
MMEKILLGLCNYAKLLMPNRFMPKADSDMISKSLLPFSCQIQQPVGIPRLLQTRSICRYSCPHLTFFLRGMDHSTLNFPSTVEAVNGKQENALSGKEN